MILIPGPPLFDGITSSRDCRGKKSHKISIVGVFPVSRDTVQFNFMCFSVQFNRIICVSYTHTTCARSLFNHWPGILEWRPSTEEKNRRLNGEYFLVIPLIFFSSFSSFSSFRNTYRFYLQFCMLYLCSCTMPFIIAGKNEHTAQGIMWQFMKWAYSNFESNSALNDGIHAIFYSIRMFGALQLHDEFNAMRFILYLSTGKRKNGTINRRAQ